MGRETSPFIVGDWWLDKRRDGKSPDVWQIASYDATSRSICYRSTRRRELDLLPPVPRQAQPQLFDRRGQTLHDKLTSTFVITAPLTLDSSRLAQGLPTLVQSAIKGKGAMPPKGGSTAPDAEIRAAVEYMVNASK